MGGAYVVLMVDEHSYNVAIGTRSTAMRDWSLPDFEWDDGNVEHLIERYDV